MYPGSRLTTAQLTFFNRHVKHFMKIRPVGAELFLADGRTDRHDEANLCERA